MKRFNTFGVPRHRSRRAAELSLIVCICFSSSYGICLRTRLLLLFLVQSPKRYTSHLDDLESDSGNITDGVTLTTETGDQDLVVLLDEVQATVLGDEGRDLLAVLDELDTNALADSRVRLLGLDTDLQITKNERLI